MSSDKGGYLCMLLIVNCFLESAFFLNEKFQFGFLLLGHDERLYIP